MPSVQHFEIIKTLYKKTSKHVVRVNKTFSLLISWIVIMNCLYLLTNDVITEITFYLVAKSKKVLINGNTYNVTEEALRTSVRMLAIFALTIIAKLSLIIILIIQLIVVNDESKLTVVLLNDFVTQFKREVSAVDYHSFILLKSYIISRMWGPTKKSLLKVELFELIPFLKDRIYRLPK